MTQAPVDVEFASEGATLRGRLDLPSGTGPFDYIAGHRAAFEAVAGPTEIVDIQGGHFGLMLPLRTVFTKPVARQTRDAAPEPGARGRSPARLSPPRHSTGMTGMRVPHQQLSEAALTGVIDDYVTREGTEYGHEDHALEAKRAQVRRQLERGDAVIVYDPESESVSLMLARDLSPDPT